MQHVDNFWLGYFIDVWFCDICGATTQTLFDVLFFVCTTVDELFQLSLLYGLLNLLPRFDALFVVMSVIFVKLAVFLLTPPF